MPGKYFEYFYQLDFSNPYQFLCSHEIAPTLRDMGNPSQASKSFPTISSPVSTNPYQFYDPAPMHLRATHQRHPKAFQLLQIPLQEDGGRRGIKEALECFLLRAVNL